MARANRDVITFAALAAVETAGFLGNACPPNSEIADRCHDPLFREELRRGYIRAGGFSLLGAAALAYLTESLWPLGGWALGTAGWVAVCESAMPARYRIPIPIPIGLAARPTLCEGDHHANAITV